MRNLWDWLKPHTGLGIVLLLASGWFWYSPGPHMFNPTEVDHLFEGDLATHYLGWAFYRNSDVGFPLGQVERYYAPIGTNIGYTDSIPLLAILFKPFSTHLPTDFQYIGLWLWLCIVLQGMYAYRCLKAIGVTDPLPLIVGSLFLVLSPVWYWRLMHPALCAHFLILASICQYLASLKALAVRKHMMSQSLLLLCAAWVHPYIGTMVWALVMIWWVTMTFVRKAIKLHQGIIGLLSAPLILLGSWYLIGYFSISGEGAPTLGLGAFSFNLNGFFNSIDASQFVSGLPHIHEQYEGFAYLGIAGFLLGLSLIVVRGFFPQTNSTDSPSPLWPLWLVTGLMAVFALSPVITWGEFTLINIKLGGSIRNLAETFRATGRFIWPLYYLIWLVILSEWIKQTAKWGSWVLIGLLCLHAVEFMPLWQRSQTSAPAEPYPQMNRPAWEELIAQADSLIFWPPYELAYANDIGDYAFFSGIAYQQNKPVSLGYVARTDQKRYFAYRDELKQRLKSGQLSHNVLYLTTPRQATEVVEGVYPYPTFLQDGYLVTLADGDPKLQATFDSLQGVHGPYNWQVERLTDFWDKHQDHLILMVAKDEASYGLNAQTQAYFQGKGVNLDQLGFRESAVVVWYQGHLCYQGYGVDSSIQQEIPQGFDCAGGQIPIALSLYSAGAESGNRAEIKVDNQVRGTQLRGLNLVVCDSAGNVVDSAHFDTYRSSIRLISDEVMAE